MGWWGGARGYWVLGGHRRSDRARNSSTEGRCVLSRRVREEEGLCVVWERWAVGGHACDARQAAWGYALGPDWGGAVVLS